MILQTGIDLNWAPPATPSANRGRTFWGQEHDYPFIHGTDEFMSDNLRLCLRYPGFVDRNYPTDDLESFFWVTTWVILFADSQYKDARTEEWRKWWTKHHGFKAMLRHLRRFSDYQSDPAVKQMDEFLLEWCGQLDALETGWNEGRGCKDSEDSKQWEIANFHQYARHGASDSLSLILKYREKLDL
ncbi:hypothetical protein E1B28_010815 [Marasmius oreades]|uniref:Fungal-type protein kinase domain-containing protein n=1 Tax=Marasmius oreades TaxID=181124 RepID=A0A9P7RTU7_9AGAR|nr:uncharacterized protein E1B28_010815 [Marasmius oreades]KAG7089106.1 hypothetical protein E1B28_010815 [Marasmius oreades]